MGEVTQATESGPPSKVNALLIGPAGSGKTDFLKDAPGKVLYVQFDPDGFDTIRAAKAMGRMVKPLEDFTILTPGPDDDLEALLNQIGALHAEHGYNTVCLDSLTSSMDMIKRYALKAAKALGMSNTADKVKGKHQLYGVPLALQDYSPLGAAIVNFAKLLFDMEFNVFVVLHEQMLLNDSGSVRKIQPNIPGNIAKAELPTLASEIYYFRVEMKIGTTERQYMVQTAKGNERDAKSRVGVLEYLEPSNLQDIRVKIAGTYDVPGSEVWSGT